MVHPSEYLYAQSRYYGERKPKNLIFNAKLQELPRQAGCIACIDKGKIFPLEAYKTLETLWEEFAQTKQELKISDRFLREEENADI